MTNADKNTPKNEANSFPSDWLSQFWQPFTSPASQKTSPLMPPFGMGTSNALGSSFQPTLDPKELEKRIADLKAVEQWLTMNLNMLRGTIQSLEVQTATLAAVQSFSQTMQEMMTQSIATPSNTKSDHKKPAQTTAVDDKTPLSKQTTDSKPITGTASSSDSIANMGSAWWQLMQQQLQQMLNNTQLNTDDSTSSSQEKLKEKATPAVKNNRQKNNKHQAEDK